MQDIGVEFDEIKAKELCKSMKSVAIEACEAEDEREAVKELTLEKLEDFGVLCKVGKKFYPTHAFDLLTDNKNKAAKIQCALFKGTTRDMFIDRKEFDRPIYKQAEEAYQFVLRHINMGAEIHGVYREDKLELPRKAIREMIANAVLHRSYLDRSCTQVSIYDDRIEVLSPGTLYGGLDITTALEGKSTCRNEAIAEAFHYMRIVEAWGTGIPRIRNKCAEYGLKEPKFEEFGDGFRVSIYRRNNPSDQLNQSNQTNQTNISDKSDQEHGIKEEIMKLLYQNTNIKIRDIGETLQLTDSQIKYYVKLLKDEGRLKREGSNRSGHWVVL